MRKTFVLLIAVMVLIITVGCSVDHKEQDIAKHLAKYDFNAFAIMSFSSRALTAVDIRGTVLTPELNKYSFDYLWLAFAEKNGKEYLVFLTDNNPIAIIDFVEIKKSTEG